MANSFLELKPNVVNENIEEHSYLLYSVGKTGKTTIATQFPNSVLIPLERGGDCIPGIYSQKPVANWGQLEGYIRDLADPKVKERFKMVIIDTGDKMVELAKEQVCKDYNERLKKRNTSKDGKVREYSKASKFKDINDNGGEWEEVGELISKTLDKIYRVYGYGIIILIHSKEKADPKDKDRKYITFDMNERYVKIFNNLVDVVGFVQNETEETPDGRKTSFPYLYFRGNDYFFAGSRFKFIREKCRFTYKDLEDSIKEAIQTEKDIVGNNFYTTKDRELMEDPEIEENYNKCVEYINNITSYLQSNFKAHATMSFKDFWLPQLQVIVKENLGDKKVSETTKDDLEAVTNTAREIQTMVKKYIS